MNFSAAVAGAIALATGEPFSPRASRVVSGGDIHAASVLDGGGRRFFVKANCAACLPMFEAEADGLAMLAASGTVRVPRVVCHGVAHDHAFLVLEYLDLRREGDAARLGEQLAALHRLPQAAYGGPRDNWIGGTPQKNGRACSWIAFWRDARLGVQFELAARKGYGGALQRDGETLRARLPEFFAGYTPAPSLLHGDLWGGNHGYLPDTAPVLFDPATYVGDRECDLAMSELFGGFSPDFHAAYRAAWPLDAGYATRRTLYNLYHVLNHANLFGGGYANEAARMTAALLAEIR